ncbi:MAG: DNA polymerase I [Peptostreptococcaceae bacterium]|nr:DNA polymerase I [Peptostreptococcaceae bacterium]
MGKILIIDGNSLLFRAYYAMTIPMVTKDGIYTQGIYSFINMLTKLRADYSPSHIMIAFDLKAPTFRHKEYKEYKAGRKPTPPELLMEIPLLHDVLDAMNIKVLELEGYEADDIIGTVSRMADEAKLDSYIVTGDKDALQLVSDNTKVIINKKGVTQFETYDLEKMQEVYELTPSEFIDLKGLMGDNSDNIPGIPGVGIKTGTSLLKEFGSIENLIEHADEIKKERIKNLVKDNSDQAIMSKRLATICLNVPIEETLDDFLVKEEDMQRLLSMYKKLEFNAFIRRLDIPKEIMEQEAVAVNILDVSKISIQKDLKELKENSSVAIKVLGDYSHVKAPQIDSIIILDKNNIYFIDSDFKDAVNILNNKKLNIMGNNIKSDIYQLMYYGLKDFTIEFDTEIAMYLLDPTRSKYLIDKMAITYLGVELENEDEFLKANNQVDLFGNYIDAQIEYYKKYLSIVFSLKEVLFERIRRFELENVLYDCELPLIEVMAEMELNGIHVDKKVLEDIGSALNKKINDLTDKIHELAGEEFNINSPKQLGVILFEKLGLPTFKKTKSGYSTNVDVLDKLRNVHPIINLILEYRTYAKLRGTYVEGMIPLIGNDEKIHPHFNQTITVTGRISCNEPNLQNIPIRNEYGRELRKAFKVADSENILIGADYSQIELRVLADISSDLQLISAFNNGEDIHKLTASRVFDIPFEDVTSIDRSRAKAVNFGVIYGMSGFGLSEELGISMKKAKEYIDEYFNKHPEVRAYMDEQIESGKEKGYVTTIMGRKRWLPELRSPKYMTRQLGERLAMNTPIQGSAADIIKLAMIRVYSELKERDFKSKLILQIHDELIIEATPDEVEEVKEILTRNMMNAMSMKVKLVSDINTGKSWFELK